jgi:hypothetical protein
VNLLSAAALAISAKRLARARLGESPIYSRADEENRSSLKTCDHAPVRDRDFKAWNGFHDLLIKIPSDVIAALESEPPWKDKAADRSGLIAQRRRH